MSCDTTKVLTHRSLLARGLTARQIVYPNRGIAQVDTTIQQRTQRYVIALAAIAFALGTVLVVRGHGLGGDVLTVAALVIVNALAERSGVWVRPTTQMTIALLPTLFAAVLFGPLAAGLVNAASMLGDPDLLARSDPDRAPRLKLVSYASSRFITGAIAGLVAQSLLGVTTSQFGDLLIASLAACLVAEILDMLFAAITARIRGRSIRGSSEP